jgi:hypothetical protein
MTRLTDEQLKRLRGFVAALQHLVATDREYILNDLHTTDGNFRLRLCDLVELINEVDALRKENDTLRRIVSGEILIYPTPRFSGVEFEWRPELTEGDITATGAHDNSTITSLTDGG